MQVKLLSDIKGNYSVLAIGILEGAILPYVEITKDITKEEFEGKAYQVCAIDTQGKEQFRKIVFFGLGKENEIIPETLRRFGAFALRYATSMKSTSVVVQLPHTILHLFESAEAIVQGAVLASYRPIKFKSKKEEYFEVKEFFLLTKSSTPNSHPYGTLTEAINRGVILATAQNFVREANEDPPNIATPQKLVDHAKALAKEKKLKITIFNKKNMEKMKMGAILGVNAGSVLPPFMVILEYNSDKKNLPLYSVVGKGITFDSGGISLKAAKGMQEMKYDKTGAVTTIGIMKAVSELKLPIRLIAAFTATENMPSGSAQKPGDIVTAYNGRTIEILNTDAEGRLILADTLSYIVKEKKPEIIIDLATLTGAIIIALGRPRIGLFSNNDLLAKVLSDAGDKTFERVWRMPLDKEYSEMIKADFADIKNIGSESGDAGSITAAAFLAEFIGDTKWAHLDIAAVDNVVGSHPYLCVGASGMGLRLVVDALERYANQSK